MGIGKATCQRLADEGARVAIADPDDDEGRAMRDGIARASGTDGFRRLHASDAAEVADGFARMAPRVTGTAPLIPRLPAPAQEAGSR